eukprot:187912-Prymnesium_polylepis.3
MAMAPPDPSPPQPSPAPLLADEFTMALLPVILTVPFSTATAPPNCEDDELTIEELDIIRCAFGSKHRKAPPRSEAVEFTMAEPSNTVTLTTP